MEIFQTSCKFGILIGFFYLLDKLAENLVELFINS